MNNLERAKLDSYDRIGLFNLKHAADLATIPDYAGEKSKFDTIVASIIGAGLVQEDDTSGNTKTSGFTKKAMVLMVIKFAKRGVVKARNANNLVLAEELDQPITYIMRATKTESVQRAKDMRNAMNNNLTVLTNITAANITQIDNAITAYDSVKDNPTVARQIKKAQGTMALPPNYALTDTAVENMYNLVYSYFDDVKPAMVDELSLARQILNTGIRHTAVIVTVVDEAGKIIPPATVKDISNEKVYTTEDKSNMVHVAKHKAGHFHFIVSAPGYVEVDLEVDVKQGMSNEFTVKLLKSI
jgi:hypothetical protein